MALLLAIIAFIMAFGALWFTSEVAKRGEVRDKRAVKPHLAPLSGALQRAEAQIRDLSRDLETAQHDIKVLKAALAQMRDFEHRDLAEALGELPESAADPAASLRRFQPHGAYDA